MYLIGFTPVAKYNSGCSKGNATIDKSDSKNEVGSPRSESRAVGKTGFMSALLGSSDAEADIGGAIALLRALFTAGALNVEASTRELALALGLAFSLAKSSAVLAG